MLRIEKLKEDANKLGFQLTYPKYGDLHGFGIRPKDNDALPIYARDTEFFSGNIDQMEAFFRGIFWAREYDQMLSVSTPGKRKRKEQDERNRLLAEILKQDDKDISNEW